MMIERIRATLRNQRGAAAAEMALIMPLLLVMVFTTLEGAHYLYVEHQIVKGVRDGARFAGRFGFSAYTCATVNAAIETQIKEVTRTGVLSGGTPRVSGWVNGDVTVTADCPATPVTTGIYKGLTNAPRVRVTATLAYPSLFQALSGVALNATVNATAQSAVMGV